MFGKPKRKAQNGADACACDATAKAIDSTTTNHKNVSIPEGQILHLADEQQWEALLARQQQLMAVKFTASWCKPCQSIAPLFQELCEKYAGQISFVEVDVDAVEVSNNKMTNERALQQHQMQTGTPEHMQRQ